MRSFAPAGDIVGETAWGVGAVAAPSNDAPPAPVALFVYNRPGHTRQTVEALARNEGALETSLTVFSDGPSSAEQSGRVEAVREYVDGLAGRNWFQSVRVFKSAGNRGLASSIIKGVTSMLDEADTVIVLEDDLVTTCDFLRFMSGALQYYRGDGTIGSVSGYTPPIAIPSDYGSDVYCVPRSCSYGWGTWASRWQDVDWDVKDFDYIRRSVGARRRFNCCGSDRYDRLRREVHGHAQSWSVRFGYSLCLRNLQSVYPVVSRVRNIGWDGSGVHPGGAVRFADDGNVEAGAVRFEKVQPDERILREWKRLYSGGPLLRAARTLRSVRSMCARARVMKSHMD